MAGYLRSDWGRNEHRNRTADEIRIRTQEIDDPVKTFDCKLFRVAWTSGRGIDSQIPGEKEAVKYLFDAKRITFRRQSDASAC